MDEASVGDEWNSGEALAITLTDQDLNLNTWLDEDLTVGSTASSQYVGSDLIPSMQIGSPLTLTTRADNSGVSMVDGISNATVQTFSKIAIATTAGTDDNDNHPGTLAINTGILISALRTADSAADYTFLNYDVTSIVQADVTAVIIEDDDHTSGATVAAVTGDGKRDLLQLTSLTAAATFLDANYLRVNFTVASASVVEVGDRFYVDIFTFGDGTTI